MLLKKKQSVGLEYFKRLKNNKNLSILKPNNSFAKNIYWVVGIVIKNKKLNLDAKKMAVKLKNQGIITRPFFWPMNKQKIFKKMKIFKDQKYPNSEYLSKFGLYLPSGIGLKKNQIKYICEKVNLILK